MNEIRQGVDPHRGKWFSLSHRLGRGLFSLVWLFFCRWTPRPLSAWRAFILRLFGAKIGKRCSIDSSVAIWAPWNLEVEDEAAVGPKAFLYSVAKIHLRRRANVSYGCSLCTGTHDYEDPLFQLQACPIEIGENAWLCAEAFVCPGISIGAGAVIGARAVVTKNMPAWTVCTGHPCKPIKPRVVRDEITPERE